MPKNIIDRDRGWKAIKQKIKRLKKSSISVGLRGSGRGKSDLATIGLYHEKGNINKRPPKRSFIGPVIDSNKSKYLMVLSHIASKTLVGQMSVERGLFGLGSLVESHIKRRIRLGILPRLAKSTKRFKAKHGKPKNTPLIHHGRLINSITHWLSK